MLTAKRWVLAVLVSLLALQFASAVTIDLGEYSITNPKFSVLYTKPVRITSELKTADLTATFNTCTNPNPASGYVEEYALYTRTSVADGACNTVQAQALTPGEYRLRLRATDQAGRVVEDFIQFQIYGITITQVAPESRVSPERPPSIVIATTRRGPEVIGNGLPAPEPVDAPSYCVYSTALPQGKTWAQTTFTDLTGKASGGQKLALHTITYDIFPAMSKDLYVICKEELSGQEAKEILKLQYDLTAPRFLEVDRDPIRVTSLIDGKGLSEINIETDDATACSITNATHTAMFPGELFTDYESYTSNHFTQLEFAPSIGATERNFTYTAICRNLAGHSNTTTFNVTVNFANVVLLELYEPGELIATPDIDLVIRSTYLADPSRLPLDECYVNDDGSKSASRRMGADTRVDAVGEFPVFVSSFSLAEGKNQFKVNCYGEKTASGAWNITLDSIPPSAPLINVSPILCAENLTVEFNSTDKGLGIIGFNYSVLNGDEEFTGVTQKRISFKPADQVSIQAFAIDAAGNVGDTNTLTLEPREGTNEQCGLPPFISIRSPGMGYAPSAPYTVEVQTYAAARCRYALAPGYGWDASLVLAPSEQDRIHSKEFTFNTKELHVICNETARNRMHREVFQIGVDSTPPRIAIEDFNNPVTDPGNKAVVLTVKTTDLTYCYLDDQSITDGRDDVQGSYRTAHNTVIDLSSVTSLERQVREYEISCQNLAGLTNSTPYEVIVHLGATMDIDILSPAQFTADDEILLSVKPSKQAVCTWRFASGEEMEFETVEGNIHNVSLGPLEEQGYQVIVSCTGAGDEGTAAWDFTVERTPPEVTDLAGPTLLCVPETYAFNVSGLDSNPTISYGIGALERNTTDELILLDPAEIEPGDQVLSVIAYNRAGISGDAATLDITVASATDDACQAPADHCTNRKLDAGEESIDCGGTCGACQFCVDDLECSSIQQCIGGVCVTTGCATADDCATGEICANGVCQAQGCQQSCGLGTVCDSNSGQCVAAVDCTNCPTGTACSEQGVCVATPACSQCGENTVCIDDLCVGLQTCGTCPAGLACNGGVCTPGGTCESVLDCEEPLVCTATSLCAAVQECSFTIDCSPGLFCNAGYCVEGVVCNPGSPCAEQDQVCSEDGFCTAAVTCSASVPCDEGYACDSGICTASDLPASGCTYDTDCDDDEECTYGMCRPLGAGPNPPPAECTYDDDCTNGELCVSGQCKVTVPSGQSDPGEDEGGFLLGVLLVFFGLGVMSGAGYFLYEQNLEKEAAKRSALASVPIRKPTGQLSSRMTQAYEQSKEQRQSALQAEYERRQAEKVKRESAFQSFNGARQTTDDGSRPTAKEAKAGKDTKDDDYVDLSAVKRKAEGKADGKANSKDDAFDELERLGK